LTQALELDNCDATLYSNRSLCYVQIGKSQKALLDADVCIARRPNWVKGYYRKGAAHMSLKVGKIMTLLVICRLVCISLLWIICPISVPQEHKKAVEAFLDGLKLDPGNAEIEKVLW
jgi:tetratricopeptide (TPR) repeat protein